MDTAASTIIHHEDDDESTFLSGSHKHDYEEPGAYVKQLIYDAPSIAVRRCEISSLHLQF